MELLDLGKDVLLLIVRHLCLMEPLSVIALKKCNVKLNDMIVDADIDMENLICAHAWLQPNELDFYQRIALSVMNKSALFASVVEGEVCTYRSLHDLFSDKFFMFGYGMVFPKNHPMFYNSDPDDNQFPEDVVCCHGIFRICCSECWDQNEVVECSVCKAKDAHFPIKDKRYCALCLSSKRLYVGVKYTREHQVSCQVSYGPLHNDFSARAVRFEDPPAEFYEENMCEIIGAMPFEEKSSSEGPVILFSSEGEVPWYIWFLEKEKKGKRRKIKDSNM